MDILTIEIKAKSDNPSKIRAIIQSKNAVYKGIDHQTDTYFKVSRGRLKLREGNIENHLIHYIRANTAGPKPSKITLFKSDPESSLKTILSDALGILTIVDKTREIYYIDTVKFHIDTVKNLGAFVEIEAVDTDGTIGEEKLLEQCEYYLALFDISKEQLVSVSYSDLILEHLQTPLE